MDAAGAFARAWRAAYGAPPADYVVLDTETTGFSPEYDRVLQIGWLRVIGGREAERQSLHVDWSAALDAHEMTRLRDRLLQTGKHIGQTPGWADQALATLCRRGVPPAEAADRFARVLATGPVLVGHNAWQFDVRMLDAFYQSQRGLPLGVPPTKLIDTMAMVRSAQSGCHPRPGETYRDYTLRAVRAGGNKYRSALDRFCIGRFRLARRFGADARLAHDALYDSWLTHLVYEDLRALIHTGRLPADEPGAEKGTHAHHRS